MTRVEKYRRYRQEIANMKFEESSSKQKLVNEQIRKDSSYDNKVIGYESVMNVFDSYDTNGKNQKHKHSFRIRKDQVRYCLVAVSVLSVLLVGIILVGINLWGK